MTGVEEGGSRVYEAAIPGGVLHLRTTQEMVPLPELLDFAARENPRRRFLFVSRVLGRHLPTRPTQLRRVAEGLAAQLPTAGPTLFFGMAETATTLGQAVFAAWHAAGGRGLYVETTRRRTGGELAFTFEEAHSHAPGHLLHRPGEAEDPAGVFAQAEQVVMVDDEATTGRTGAGLLAAYQQWRGAAVPGTLAVLVHWQGETALPVCALLEGSFRFEATGSQAVPALPPEPAAPVEVPAPRARRHGLAQPQEYRWSALPAGRVLVVGVGELGYPALLLAEAVEAAGGTAWVQATTRSPVLPGGAIQHRREFPALTGEGYREYLYNVPEEHGYERVILLTEDAPPPATHPVYKIPRLEIWGLPAL